MLPGRKQWRRNPNKRVFVNRSVAMNGIKAIGFDMDYKRVKKLLWGYFWQKMVSIFKICVNNQFQLNFLQNAFFYLDFIGLWM